MKRILIILGIFIVIIFSGTIYADIVNPYSSISQVKPFFTTFVQDDGTIVLKQSHPLHFIHTPFDWQFHIMTSALRVFGNAKFSERPIVGNEEQIIQKIHEERFDVTKPYVISGGHFAELYPRNFGIFYSAMMDGRFAFSHNDWLLRQRVTLQTLATDLELMKQAMQAYTTFELITPDTFIGEKVYTDQSDSLFAVVWTLSAVTNGNFLATIFPASVESMKIHTQQAGTMLIAKYKMSLETIIDNYLNSIINPQTGLIKKDITLSSARDGIKRQSSFYDNVIAWSTAKLAVDLGMHIHCPNILQINSNCDFSDWKQKIIHAFWDEKQGIFLDDLSDESKQEEIFSGDEFIVTSTQFLDLKNNEDRQKLLDMIAYVKKNNFDKPLPLRYAKKDQPDRFYLPVRLFMGSYMGESIWSHWGIEYIKTLILLSDKQPEFLSDARIYLESYQEAILRYGGYPELYDKNGDIFKTPFYKSILHTGWVVNYEQARMMLGARENSK